MQISIVIPVYNEADSVQTTAESLRASLNFMRTSSAVELILVDDGSSDGTGPALEAAFSADENSHVILLEQNMGIGAALRAGFAHATGDVIVTTDFDGTYPFSSIPLLVARLQVMKADVVVASPYHPYGGVADTDPNQQLLGRAASVIYRLVVSRSIHSWTSLSCAYRRPVLDRVDFERDDALATTELLVNAIYAGFAVTELPVRLKQRPHGTSRVSATNLAAQHVLLLANLTANRLTGTAPKSSHPISRKQSEG
jgi:dolichol-phosphate mannosyltransferase